MREAGRPTSGQALLMALAALVLTQALGLDNGCRAKGALSLLALSLLALSLILGVAAVISRGVAGRWLLAVLGLIAVGQMAQIAWLAPAQSLDTRSFAPFLRGVGVAALLMGMLLSQRPWLGRATLPLLLIVFGLMGGWVLRHTDPGIDVQVFQQVGAEAAIRGQNPYALRMPNVYDERLSSMVYSPGVWEGNQLTTGYPYMPLSLAANVVGYLLGDIRWPHLLAMIGAAAFIAAARPDAKAAAVAAIFLFSPRAFYFLEMAWTEPLVILFLAATVCCAARTSRWLPLALGLLLASKQYLLLLLPLVPLLAPPGQRLSTAWKAIAVAAVITLPAALWDLPAFFNSAVLFQIRQPLRADALSFIAWPGASPALALIGFLAAGGVIALALWRAPRSAGGFVGCAALVLMVFFAFNKQAFLNYYYVVLAAMWIFVALADDPPDASQVARA